MSREIKFRAWVIDSKKMYHVVKIWWFNGKPSHISALLRGKQTEEGDNERIMIRERFELMQYTGLKDKNGKEIYEGDIIRRYGSPRHAHLVEEFPIKFLCGSFMFADCPLCDLSPCVNCEIIGNIYESKHLLNQ